MSWQSSCKGELWDVLEREVHPEIDENFSHGGGQGWICTRHEGHTGNHVGGSGSNYDDPKNDSKWIEWNSKGIIAYQLEDGIKCAIDPNSIFINAFVIEELY